MARVAEFGVIPVFRDRDGRLAVQPQMIFPSEDDARRAAQIFAEVLGGAVAFSRVADREAGIAEDGVIIAKYGAMAKSSQEPRPPKRRPEPKTGTRSRAPDPQEPPESLKRFFPNEVRLSGGVFLPLAPGIRALCGEPAWLEPHEGAKLAREIPSNPDS